MKRIFFMLCVSVLWAGDVSGQEGRWLSGSRMNAARRAAAARHADRAHQSGLARQARVAQVSALSADETVNTTPARYIPHLAQGQGWTTYLDIINVCDTPAEYSIDFRGNDGELREFEFEDGRYNGVTSGDSPLGNSIDTFLLQDTGSELIQGFGVVVEGGSCIAVDTFYVQERQEEEGESSTLYATVPLQRLATAGATLTFYNVGECDTAMALAGTGGSARLEAFGADGEALGSYSFLSLHHDAFSIGRRFPRTRGRIGMLRLSGEAALVGMDFCSDRLMQFRLPHLSPLPDVGSSDDEEEEAPGSEEDKSAVVELFEMKITDKLETGNAYVDRYTFGIKLQIRNPNDEEKIYSASVSFKDEDGFLIEKMSFWPNDTHDVAGVPLICWSGTNCQGDLVIPAGESRRYLGNIKLYADDGKRVDLNQTTVSVATVGDRVGIFD